MKVVDQCRAARSDLESVLVIRDGAALGRCQNRRIAFGILVKFATVAALQRLVMNCHLVRDKGLGWFSSHLGSPVGGRSKLNLDLATSFPIFSK